MAKRLILQMQVPGDSGPAKRKRRNSIVAAEPVRKSRRLREQPIQKRKSRRLQEQVRHIKAEHSVAKQLNPLPSPSTSRTRPKASKGGRKRKAALPEDNPDWSQVSCEPRRKRLQTSSCAVSDCINHWRRHSGCPEEPAKELEAREIEQKERQNPISYWAAHHTWPKDFAEHNLMASSNSTNKRQRTSECMDVRSRSYSQSRKDGEVPEQYTPAYETHIFSKGLNMDTLRGEELISEESKQTCVSLQEITHNSIKPTIYPAAAIRKVINLCRNRNEAMVNRDVTPMIVPPLRSLYLSGDSHLEHVVDEVNADWYQQCVLEGPQLRPDLAVGLFSSAFTEGDIDKLKRYNSVDNWTQVTSHMYFPFLMCEVKCGNEGLDFADRQNMHSCSVAVRAILRFEREADKYRAEKKMDSLNGQVLVFSISHDQQDARLYGHYAVVQEEKWMYYRYRIRKFDLTDNNGLLAIYNFVQNILKSYLPRHLQRLQDALAALPDGNKPPESSGLPSSSGLSFAASAISLNGNDNSNNSQQDSQSRDADGFVVPPRPAGSQDSRARQKGLRQLLKEAEQEKAQLMHMLEEQRKESSSGLSFAASEISGLRQLLEEQRKEARQEHEKAEQEREKAEQERAQLMQTLKQQSEEAKREREKAEQEREKAEQEREKAEQERAQLMQTLKQQSEEVKREREKAEQERTELMKLLGQKMSRG
ncbi:MAG: hypothetical protein M1816_002176 [Peltula sp. TS41687]|nr:MAG: hypothetical protein M1816_002176 [Peltula sp. TS41687]